MKQMIGGVLAAALLLLPASPFAQRRDKPFRDQDLKMTGGGRGHDADQDAGIKLILPAPRDNPRITDKVSTDQVGPKGEIIYVNFQSRFYYVDRKGRKVFVRPEDLRDK